MQKESVPQLIDVNKIFKDKNPGLYKILPAFILNFIKKVIHQDEMNLILDKGKKTDGIEFATIVLNEMGVKVTCIGLENIPASGAVIVSANHPLGGLDAMAIISLVGQKRRDLKFLVNDILTLLPNFGEVFVPVNKFGSNAKSNLERIETIYASDAAVILFPAGFCSRKRDGKVQDFDWVKSFVAKAQKYQHPIVPIFVRGKNTSWFYNLAQFRMAIGIKANIEMFYLADEMFKQKGQTIEIIIGKPIDSNLLDAKHSAKEWASLIKKFVYLLEQNPELSFQEYLEKPR